MLNRRELMAAAVGSLGCTALPSSGTTSSTTYVTHEVHGCGDLHFGDLYFLKYSDISATCGFPDEGTKRAHMTDGRRFEISNGTHDDFVDWFVKRKRDPGSEWFFGRLLK